MSSNSTAGSSSAAAGGSSAAGGPSSMMPPSIPQGPGNTLTGADAQQTITAATITQAIALILLVLRFYTRGGIVRSIRADDWVVLVTFLLSCVTYGCIFSMAPYGLGQHGIYNPLEVGEFIKRLWIFNFVQGIATGAIELGIALFMLQLAKKTTYEKYLWVLMAIIGAYTIEWTVSNVLLCRPISLYWNVMMSPQEHEAYCMSQNLMNVLFYVNFGLTTLIEVMLLVLPLPIIWNLKMSLRIKITTMCILSLGLLATIISIMVFVVNYDLIVNPHTDPTEIGWYNASLILWNQVQVNVAIIASCLATMRPLLNYFVQKMDTYLGTRRTRKGGSTTDGSTVQTWNNKTANSTVSKGDTYNKSYEESTNSRQSSERNPRRYDV